MTECCLRYCHLSVQPGRKRCPYHMDLRREVVRRWRAKHLESHRLALARWRAANPERAHAIHRKYVESHTTEIRQRRQRWRSNNPDAVRRINQAAHRRWREKNIDAVRAAARIAARKHREKDRKAWNARVKRWRLANPDRAKASGQSSRLRRKDYINAYTKRLREKNPSFAIGMRLRIRLWGALKKQSATQSARMVEVVGCTMAELTAHLEHQFLDGMSWSNRKQWHIDHIRPCASFDLQDPEQQRACFHYTNLRPLWAKDNMSKGAGLVA